MDFRLSHTEKYTMYTLEITFLRVPSMQIQKTFLPVLLMEIVGYSTLFVDMERPDIRFNGALTTILVQAAWMNVISNDLPTTSYLKLIDFWFTWHLLLMFLVILYHVFVDKMRMRIVLIDKDAVEPFDGGMIPNDVPVKKHNPIISNFNKVGIVILVLANCLFYGLYFSLSFGKI